MALASPITLVAGSHVWFALNGATLSDASNVIKPDGDSTSYTVVGPTAKPSASDTSWVKAGIVTKSDVDPGLGDVIVVQTPMPGQLVPTERIRTGSQPKLNVTVGQIDRLVWRLVLQTAAIGAATETANPFGGAGEVLAWARLQAYRHNNAHHCTLDVWGEVVVSSAISLDPKAKTEVTFEFNILHSALNVIDI